MAYPALTLHLLISAPGDVPDDDRRVVREAIDAWNFTSGRWLVPTPVTVIPVEWGVHAYSQMGVRPQEALNKQFVQESDMALAIFANRLGTPTGEADSGTVEEIDVMRRAGKPVSLVRNTSVAMSGGTDAAEQRLKLENYLAGVIKDRQGLVVQYDQLHVLHRQIDLMLTGQAMAFSQAAAQPTEAVTSERDTTWNVEKPDPPTVDPTVGVWPSVEVVERPTTDSKGRLKTRRTWYLVLNNATGRPVRNVRFRYETGEDQPFDLRSDHEAIPTMAPESHQRFPIMVSMQSARQAECIVSWQYQPEGEVSLAQTEVEEHETRATVRTV